METFISPLFSRFAFAIAPETSEFSKDTAAWEANAARTSSSASVKLFHEPSFFCGPLLIIWMTPQIFPPLPSIGMHSMDTVR